MVSDCPADTDWNSCSRSEISLSSSETRIRHCTGDLLPSAGVGGCRKKTKGNSKSDSVNSTIIRFRIFSSALSLNEETIRV